MANIRIKITRVGQPFYGQVRTLDLEDYLVGVVSSEMSDKWPLEALMAQAVAARTYAMAHMRSSAAYDMDDTTKYQAYRYRKPGAAPNVENAVKATAGMALRYGGKLISAVYSASNGGQVRSSKDRWGSNIAYLQAKPDPWDKATGLPRFGHGVGMSQRGAQWAANHGVSWRDILAFYYPGCAVDGEKPAPAPSRGGDRPAIPATVRKGDNGAAVTKLQQELNAAGAKLMVDGIFGPRTDAAVHAYQKKNGLVVDGIAGPKTWGSLLE
jgi:peptidoglycan hydrolase-like amidase